MFYRSLKFIYVNEKGPILKVKCVVGKQILFKQAEICVLLVNFNCIARMRRTTC